MTEFDAVAYVSKARAAELLRIARLELKHDDGLLIHCPGCGGDPAFSYDCRWCKGYELIERERLEALLPKLEAVANREEYDIDFHGDGIPF